MALNNSQYNEIMNTLSERRIQRERELSERKELIKREIPEIKELDLQISLLSRDALSKMRSGNKEEGQRLKERIEGIIGEKKSLLRAKGYSEDFLSYRPYCKQCNDEGLIDGRKCRCFIREEMKYLYRQSGISESIKEENFDTFDLSLFDDRKIAVDHKTVRGYMERLCQDMKDYAENFCKESKSLLFKGSPGTGKTFLMNCIAREVMNKGIGVLYLTSSDMFESMYHKGGENDMDFVNYDLLMIDDLGTEVINGFTASKLFYILNERLKKHLPTVISTNLSMKTIGDQYSSRVSSRILYGYEYIPFYGDDIRLRER